VDSRSQADRDSLVAAVGNPVDTHNPEADKGNRQDSRVDKHIPELQEDTDRAARAVAPAAGVPAALAVALQVVPQAPVAKPV